MNTILVFSPCKTYGSGHGHLSLSFFFFFGKVPCIIIFKLINIYLYLFLAALGLCRCLQAFSSCSAQAYCRGFACWRAQVLGCVGFRVVAHGLSCLVEYGLFPDWGSNPYRLHWQADSQPLDHKGSTWSPLFIITTLLYYLTIISCQLLTWLDLTF